MANLLSAVLPSVGGNPFVAFGLFQTMTTSVSHTPAPAGATLFRRTQKLPTTLGRGQAASTEAGPHRRGSV